MPPKNSMSRRRFLRTVAMGGGAAMLAACGAGGATQQPAGGAAAGNLPFQVAPEAMNPLNVAAGEVDGVFFAGGFGDDYIKYAAKLEEQLHPGTTVKVQSIQNVSDQLQPRFVAGTPPDVIDNS